MRNEILRDVLFACAGVLMVMALIGLPRPATTEHQQWQMNPSQCQAIKSPGQGAQLLPCYMPKPPPPPPAFPKSAPPTP